MTSQEIIKYSRQLSIADYETGLSKIKNSHILVVGANLFGVELCRNLCLTGFQNITLLDSAVVGDDQSVWLYKHSIKSQYKVRVLADYLQQFCESEITCIVDKNVSEELSSCSHYNTVVLSHFPFHKEIEEIEYICHQKGINLLIAETFGASYALASRLVSPHSYKDIIGKFDDDYPHFLVKNWYSDDKNHIQLDLEVSGAINLQEGDFVALESAKSQPYQVLSIAGKSVIIDVLFDSSHKKPSTIIKLPQVKSVQFEPLLPLLMKPFEATKIENRGNSRSQQKSNYTLFHFVQQLINSPQRTQIVSSADDELFDVTLFERLVCSLKDGSQLPPLVAACAATAAQEVFKSIVNNFKPVEQLYFCSHDYIFACDKLETMELFQSRARDVNIVVVGAGALGCEIVKNLALMDCCTGQGELTIIDDDRISISNFHRQFFFRDGDANKFKAEVVAQRAKEMNPSLHVTAFLDRVSPFNFKSYPSTFWKKQDIIIGAVDSFNARIYLCELAAFYGKIYLESGTDALIASSSIFLPSICARYGETMQIEEEEEKSQQHDHSIGYTLPENCTPKYIPYHSKFAIQWAVDKFTEMFTNAPTYYSHQQNNEVSSKENFTIASLLQQGLADSLKELTELFFQKLFQTEVLEIQRKYPKDRLTANGELFWSGIMHFPIVLTGSEPLADKFKSQALQLFENISKNQLQPIEFDNDNEMHLQMIDLLHQLRCLCFDLIPETDRLRIQQVAANFVPSISFVSSNISGTVLMNLYPSVLGSLQRNSYRNTNIIMSRSNELNLFLPIRQGDPVLHTVTISKTEGLLDDLKLAIENETKSMIERRETTLRCVTKFSCCGKSIFGDQTPLYQLLQERGLDSFFEGDRFLFKAKLLLDDEDCISILICVNFH